MPDSFRASRDVIIRTEQFEEAVRFYETVLGLAVVHRTTTLVGFDAGAFRLYVEPGPRHGAVFDFRVPEMKRARSALLAAGCRPQARSPEPAAAPKKPVYNKRPIKPNV